MPDLRPWSLVYAAFLAIPGAGQAQVRASERAGVFQDVNGARITVEYGRPAVRGRSDMYGGAIPWGKVWTPGANWATTLEVDRNITINGLALAAGEYAVWMEVQPQTWTVILDSKVKAFHTNPPKPDASQVRFAVTPTDVVGPELLTWSFSDISSQGTTLCMAWAGKAVSMDIVTPTTPLPKVSSELAGRYTGSYQVIFGPGTANREIPADAPPEWQVRHTDGFLRAEWAHPPFDVWHELVLLEISEDWFHPGAMVDGALYDVVTDLAIEFAVSNGRATGFDIRGPNDAIVGRGRLVSK